jgi:hypothetical protein
MRPFPPCFAKAGDVNQGMVSCLVQNGLHSAPKTAHACRAALVLASAAERLGNLLRSQAQGPRDTRLAGAGLAAALGGLFKCQGTDPAGVLVADQVEAAALVEARYAVRFMMESLFPGVVLREGGTSCKQHA